MQKQHEVLRTSTSQMASAGQSTDRPRRILEDAKLDNSA